MFAKFLKYLFWKLICWERKGSFFTYTVGITVHRYKQSVFKWDRGSVFKWDRGSVFKWDRGSVFKWDRGSVFKWDRDDNHVL